jgi:hypothetical protein
MDRFSHFREINDIPGYLTYKAMIVWDFLLTNQTSLGINGGFLKIGVREWKSATFSAMYISDDEPLVLIDVDSCEAALAGIRQYKDTNVRFLQLRSTLAAKG